MTDRPARRCSRRPDYAWYGSGILQFYVPHREPALTLDTFAAQVLAKVTKWRKDQVLVEGDDGYREWFPTVTAAKRWVEDNVVLSPEFAKKLKKEKA